MDSSSTGVPSGILAIPYTKRQGFLSFPRPSVEAEVLDDRNGALC
jgi:hypothetical protein